MKVNTVDVNDTKELVRFITNLNINNSGQENN